MKITLVISSLISGGAERVLCSMANYWTQRGNEISVVTFSQTTSDFYPLDGNIRRISLDSLHESGNIFSGFAHNLKRLWRLNRTIRVLQSEVVISFMDTMNVLVLLAAAGSRQKIIVTEHTDPQYQPIGPVWSWLRRLTYPHAAGVVVLSKKIQDWYLQVDQKKAVFFPRLDGLIHVLPNPIDCDAILEKSREQIDGQTAGIISGRKNVFIQVARLSPEKNPFLLVQACEILRDKGQDFIVLWVGQGPLFVDMQGLIKDKTLEDHIFLLGQKENPYPYMAAARSALLTSDIEGFGLVLAEAMVCGAVPISTDHYGPRQILDNGRYGELTPAKDPKGLAEAMQRMIVNEALYREKKNGAADFVRRFDTSVIMNQWEGLIGEICH